MTGPDPLEDVEPLPGGDPALADAPMAVRRADAWLRSTRRARRIAAGAGLVGLIALDAARDRLRIELERTRATIAETYAALAELAARPEPSVDLDDTMKRLSAELEVDRTATQAQRAARSAARLAAARKGQS